MGNSSSTHRLWPPGKLFNRKSKHTSARNRTSKHHAPPVAPMYDTVAEFPVYSVVDKNRTNNIKVEENVQYAEIEVVRPSPRKSQKKPPVLPNLETEYATLNFPGEPNSTSQPTTVPQNRQFSQGNSAGPPKPPKKYKSSNGTLV